VLDRPIELTALIRPDRSTPELCSAWA